MERTADPVADPPRLAWLRDRILRVYRHSLARFLIFSGTGFLIDVTLLFLLEVFTPLPRWAAVSIAFWITYLGFNFPMNRRFSFHADSGSASKQFVRFIPQVLADFALTVGGVEFYARVFGVSDVVARVIAGFTNLVLNYIAYRFWTFRKGARRSRDR